MHKVGGGKTLENEISAEKSKWDASLDFGSLCWFSLDLLPVPPEEGRIPGRCVHEGSEMWNACLCIWNLDHKGSEGLCSYRVNQVWSWRSVPSHWVTFCRARIYDEMCLRQITLTQMVPVGLCNSTFWVTSSTVKQSRGLWAHWERGKTSTQELSINPLCLHFYNFKYKDKYNDFWGKKPLWLASIFL